ncbi:MAG: hypothetical protein ABII12_17935 [Planctomycetota bacterium]
MALWVSPITSGYSHSAWLWPWWGSRARLGGLWCWWHPVDGLRAMHAHRALYSSHPCDSEVVPPAYYVELRALRIREEELEVLRHRYAAYDFSGRALRPWPFRWPELDVIEITAPPPDPPSQDAGECLNILI